MARRFGLGLVAVVVLAFSVQAVRAATLAEVKQKVNDRIQKCKTLRQTTHMTMTIPGQTGQMVATSKMEFARRGKDKWVTRTDMVMKPAKEGGPAGMGEMKMTMIYDGQFVYHITQQGGQKMAMKMRPNQGRQKITMEPNGLDQMEKDYDLTLLPDEKVHGKKVWVMQAKLKKGQAEAGAFDRMVVYCDQATGMLVKTVSYDKSGKVVATMEVTDVAENVKIPDSQFKVPAGVQVMDMTRGMPSMPMDEHGGE